VSPLSITPQAILEGWNSIHDGQAAARIEEHLVRRIRTWRPEVIVTENVNPRQEDALSQVISQLVLAAAEKAAKAESYPDQLEHLGLAPWKVKKIFGVHSGERQGTVNVSPSQWSAGLSRSLAEVAEEARAILTDDDRPAPISIGLSLLVDHLPQNTGRRDVFSGIVLLAGGEARRQPLEPPSGNLDELARAAQKRHNVQQLLSRAGERPGQAGSLLAQTGELLEGISDRSAGEILFQLARQYHRSGQGEAAAETLQLLLQRFPEHPLADAAALWLVQYYSSGEIAWRQRQTTRSVVQAVAAGNSAPGPFPVATAGTGAVASDGSARPASAIERVGQERAGKALTLGRLIERSRPALHADPEFRFPLLTALRAQGEMKQADLFFASLAKTAGNDPWGRCATSEQCLAQGRTEPPKLIVSCATATQRPKLDGRLDDELWRAARLVSLTGAGGDSGADVVLARDDEYVYVAISCQKLPGGDYEPDAERRSYDADLTSRDRVEIHLDIDRDYASFWSLAVDCRGFTTDRVMGDATWNPTWYVASGGDAQYWTAEIAVPLSQLVSSGPKSGDTWAVGIQRLIPNVGLHSATHPASVDVRPEGFGLLRFEK
jgi:TolA-binding protein